MTEKLLSDELLALIDADDILDRHRAALFTKATPLEYLETDAVTKAAFSALCGAKRYIERLTQAHVTGRGSENVNESGSSPRADKTPSESSS